MNTCFAARFQGKDAAVYTPSKALDEVSPSGPAAKTAEELARTNPARSGTITEAELHRFSAAVVKLEAWRDERASKAPAEPAAHEKQKGFLLVRRKSPDLAGADGKPLWPGVYYDDA